MLSDAASKARADAGERRRRSKEVGDGNGLLHEEAHGEAEAAREREEALKAELQARETATQDAVREREAVLEAECAREREAATLGST